MKVQAHDLPWNLETAYNPMQDGKFATEKSTMRTKHCTGYTHEMTTTVVHDSDIARSRQGRITLVSTSTGISCHRTGSPGKSHRQEQRGPWLKDGPAIIHKQQNQQLSRIKKQVLGSRERLGKWAQPFPCYLFISLQHCSIYESVVLRNHNLCPCIAQSDSAAWQN
jgi:hypothetical protein